jgi:hypothetical protein
MKSVIGILGVLIWFGCESESVKDEGRAVDAAQSDGQAIDAAQNDGAPLSCADLDADACAAAAACEFLAVELCDGTELFVLCTEGLDCGEAPECLVAPDGSLAFHPSLSCTYPAGWRSRGSLGGFPDEIRARCCDRRDPDSGV